MTIGRVHLLYGVAGSGKTSRARELCAGGRAVRFTLDEWMIRLYPDLDFASSDYGVRAEEVKDLIWSVAEQVLHSGTDVVLDWNSWSRQRRAWAIQRAQAVGAEVHLHWLRTPVEEASGRAARRARAATLYAHRITREDNEHLNTLMEPPSESEGLWLIGD